MSHHSLPSPRGASWAERPRPLSAERPTGPRRPPTLGGFNRGQGRHDGAIEGGKTRGVMRAPRSSLAALTVFRPGGRDRRDTTGNSQRVPANSSSGCQGDGLRPTPRSRSRHLPQQLLAIQRQAQRRAQIGRGRAEVRGGGGGAHPRSAAIEGEVARSEAEGDVHLACGPGLGSGLGLGLGSG